MATVIAKSAYINNPNNDNINGAQFAMCVSTTAGQTVIVKDVDSNTLGEAYLYASGDTVVLEKSPTDTITLAQGHVMAVGSPRS
jgi:hypothetical protein